MIRAMRSSRRFGGSSRRRRVFAVTLTGIALVALAVLKSARSAAVPSEPLPPLTSREAATEPKDRPAVFMPAPAQDPAAKPTGDRDLGLAAVPAANAVDTSLDATAMPSKPLHPVSGKPVRAEIITCPACRLNKLPKVKRFVKELATHFTPALNVHYISGRDPRLHLYEADVEVADIDLAEDDEAQIVRRLLAHGIRPREMTEDITQLLDDAGHPTSAVGTLVPATSQSLANAVAQHTNFSATAPAGSAPSASGQATT